MADDLRVLEMIDAELARLRSDDDLEPPAWWDLRQRRWIDGIRAARAASAHQLQAIRDALAEP